MSSSDKGNGPSPPVPPGSQTPREVEVIDLLAKQELDQDAIKNVLDTEDAAHLSKLYGETSLEGMKQIFNLLSQVLPSGSSEKRLNFVDIGSGRGHAIFYASCLLENYESLTGIEMVPEHVAQADKTLKNLSDSSNIKFICEDVLQEPTPDSVKTVLETADVVYCFDLAFPSATRSSMANPFDHLRPETILIVTHLDPFPSVEFAPVLPLCAVKMDWGQVPVRIYSKREGSYDAWIEGHLMQLEKGGVPKSLWRSAHKKLVELSFDIGNFASLAKVENTESLVMVASQDIAVDTQIFIVDHAWTFESIQDARESLKVRGLKDRLWALCGAANIPQNDPLSSLLIATKTLLGSYTVVGPSGKETSIYYMLDEIGSRIRRHPNRAGPVGSLQGEANFRMIPIYSHDYRMAFSLAWPIAQIKQGEVMVADHEQGWDITQDIQITENSSESSAMPEMKEYAAQVALKRLIESEAQFERELARQAAESDK